MRRGRHVAEPPVRVMPPGLTLPERLLVRAAWLERTMRRISHGSMGGGVMPYMPLVLSGDFISTAGILVTGALGLVLSLALPVLGERVLAREAVRPSQGDAMLRPDRRRGGELW